MTVYFSNFQEVKNFKKISSKTFICLLQAKLCQKIENTNTGASFSIIEKCNAFHL